MTKTISTQQSTQASTLADTPGNDQAVRPASSEHEAKVRKVAEEFEALFIRTMLSQMGAATRELAGTQGSFAEENSAMLDLADSAVADQLAAKGYFGIADAVTKELLRENGNIAIKNSPRPVASLKQRDEKIASNLVAFAEPLHLPFRNPRH